MTPKMMKLALELGGDWFHRSDGAHATCYLDEIKDTRVIMRPDLSLYGYVEECTDLTFEEAHRLIARVQNLKNFK